MLPQIANVFQIWWTLAGYEDEAAGFKPIRNREIFWMNDNQENRALGSQFIRILRTATISKVEYMHEVCVVKLLWILSFLQVSFRRQIGSALIFCRRDSVQHSTWLDRWRPLTNVFETLDAGQTGKNIRGGPLTKFYTGTLRLEVQTLVFISGGLGPSLFLDQTEARRAEKSFLETEPPPPVTSGSGWPPASLISRAGSSTVFYIQFWTEKVPLSFTFYWQIVLLSHT